MDAEQLQQRLLQQHNDNIIVSQQNQQVATAAAATNGADGRQHALVTTNSTQPLNYTPSLPAAQDNSTYNPKHFYYIRHFADASRGSSKVLTGSNNTAATIPSSLPVENVCRKPPSSARELRALLPLHIFVERDYRTKHVGVQFERDMPALLSRLRFPAERYFNAIDRLNEIYARLERVSCRTVTEFLFNCVTCYLFVPCSRSTYERVLLDADRALSKINDEWAAPEVRLNAKLCNPRERGFRFLELIVYELPPDAQDETGDGIDGRISVMAPKDQQTGHVLRPDDGDAMVSAT